MHRLPIPALLLLMVMIPGCAGEPPPPPEIRQPVVDDAVKVGCPEAAPEDVAESKRMHARPVADTKWPDGRPAVSLGALQSAVDERDVAISRKNRVIGRLIGHINGCRGAAPVTGKGSTS